MKKQNKRKKDEQKLNFSLFLLIITCSLFIILFLFNPSLKNSLYFHSLTQWLRKSPVESLLYTMGMENKYFRQVLPEERKPPSMLSVSLELFTSIEPQRLATLIGNEIPGFRIFDTKIIVAGKGTDYTTLPIESSPPMDVLLKERESSKKRVQEIQESEKENKNHKEEPLRTTQGKKVAFIYHTHSRESFLPYLDGEDDPDNAHDTKINIMLVGKKFGEQLNQKGIGAEVNTTDIVEELDSRGLDYYSSYKMSRELLEVSTNQNRDLTFFFDLHRDSQRRKVTTTTINGKSYARLFFIIGTEYKNHEKNLMFAKELNTSLEEKYPGISRGIFEKGRSEGNGVYNQDLSPNSIIIEVGGVDNTMEEMYRTTDALAEVIAQYYWQAEPVMKQ